MSMDSMKGKCASSCEIGGRGRGGGVVMEQQ